MSPFRVVLIFITLSVIGIALLPLLEINLVPKTNQPIISLQYSLPNSPPDIVEAKVTAPLENGFSQISQIKTIKSVSNYNEGSITIEFNKSVDLQYKRFEVLALLRQIYPQLPSSMSYPIIHQGKADSKRSSLLVYSIYAPFAPYQIITQVNEQVANPLRHTEGVQEAIISGVQGLQVSIAFDLEKLEEYKLSKENLEGVLRLHMQDKYLGLAKYHSGQQFFVQAKSSLKSIEDLENLVVATIQNKETDYLLKLKEVAQVNLKEKRPLQHYRINGENAIRLSITAQKGVNKLILARQLKEKISYLKQRLPQGYQLRLDVDETEYLNDELDKIYQRSGLSIFILSLFILIVNRSTKYLLILITGLAVNLGITIIFIYILQIDIHLYSLAGLTVSFGLIVDNAIVMLDHYHRKRNRSIFLALLAASLTTIVALLIIFLLPEEERFNLTEFAEIIAVNLGVSLLVALFYTPALYKLVEDKPKVNMNTPVQGFLSDWDKQILNIYGKTILFLGQYRKLFILFNVLIFGVPVFLLPRQIEGENWSWYNRTIGSDYYQENIRMYVDQVLGGTLRMFVMDVFEKSGYREVEKTALYINAEMPYGNTLKQMDFIIQKVENYLKQVDGLNQFVTHVYSGQNSSIQITFQSQFEKSILPHQLKNKLITQSLDWGGVEWNIFGVGQGFSNNQRNGIPSFRVEIRGYNYNVLEKQANLLASKLLAHGRIQKVNTNERLSYREKASEVFIYETNKKLLANSGLNLTHVVQQLQIHTTNDVPLMWTNNFQSDFPKSSLPLVLEEKDAVKFSKYDLLNKYINISVFPNQTTRVQLSNFGNITLKKTNNALHKENRQYVRIVGYEYLGSYHFGKKHLNQVLEEAKNTLPLGYNIKSLSNNWDYDQVKWQYGVLLILFIAIFFICSILFESFHKPFLIIATIPISFIGLFLTFALFGFYFDQGGYAAFILLGGLVVNASIFILYEFNEQSNTMEYLARLLISIQNKAIPIGFTIISTICGFIPFLMEGQNEIFWFSLAIGTIGGLIFSIYAILIFLPVVMMKIK